MMNKATMARIAASSILLGVTMVGCKTAADDSRPGFASDVRSDKGAARSAANAQKALGKGDLVNAVSHAEAAVALAARDPNYRALLGRAYLAAGRFESAATSFGDALALDSTQSGAALSLALAQTALGKWDAARSTIETYQTIISDADRGLALSLAGNPQGGVTLLETTVRAGAGDAKVRQNLALSYALAGRWTEARTMAAYDLPQGEADKRIMEWSSFSRPSAASDQVATLLHVTPSSDPGQPARLALNLESGQALAQAPVAPPPPPERIADEVEVAEVVAQPRPEAQPSTVPTIMTAFSGVTFAPRAEVVQPLPKYAPRVADAPLIRAVSFAPKRRLAPLATAGFKRAALVRPSEGGKFVVQLGAYSQSSRVETAWNRSVGRFGALTDFTPASATFVTRSGSAALYRLSIAGFGSRGDAQDVCQRIKATGGSCFVRVAAGDAPTQWAARNVGPRLASR